MIDSHTHLASCAEDDADLVAEARAAGVERILTVGMESGSWARALEAADAHPEVFAALGRHPNLADGYDDDVLAALRDAAAHPRCRAIGETGLDYFRDHGGPAGRDRQARAFVDQIALARELDRPVVVHSRAAEEDTLRILERHADGLDVVLHCFSMPDQLDRCLEHDRWSISFAGNVTYPANSALADAAARVPDDRILVETDAPYLTPQPHRRERNRPARVVDTAAFLAERRGSALATLDAQVTANAARLLGW